MDRRMKELTSLQHPLVKYWVSLRDDAGFRKEHRRVLLEGKNAIKDIAKRHKPKRLITTSQIDLEADEVLLVNDAIMKKISSTMAPEGLIAEFEMPKNRPFAGLCKIVVSDRIQDPGNLGTIIRSALAFGWNGIFLLPGSCDPPKAQRLTFRFISARGKILCKLGFRY